MINHIGQTQRWLRNSLLCSSALIAVGSPMAVSAQELPTGGQVVAGAATIATAGNQMTVNTSTNRTVVDWSSFSIGTGNKVQINQPNAQSINVNRVTGTAPSQIFGALESNGRVVLANPNGVWFGPNAHVDVAGIVASAGRIDDGDVASFAAGGALRIGAGEMGASVINDGVISVADGGLAAFVAPGVRNNGTITARLGQVHLAAGTSTTLDFYGDGLINLQVGGQVSGQADGAAVENKGGIYADGGSVRLSARAASGVVDNVINMSGVIQARGVSTAGGTVELLGGDSSVAVSGTVDVSGQAGHDGGTIRVKAGQAVNNADGVLNLTGTLNASSDGGAGGSVNADARFAYLGGDIHADGARGGHVSVHAAGVSQSGAVTANATSGDGGAVKVAGRLNVTQTLSAVTSANSASGKGGSVTVEADAGRVFSSGTLTAKGSTGGAVDVVANDIALVAAKLDASGTQGDGGAIRVGGDLHGAGLRTAATTFVNAATTLNASAATDGQGGKIVVWSDQKSEYQGSAIARGGRVSGDGGMIEVSSKGTLTFSGTGDAGATHGKAGTLLLDPKDIIIDDRAGGLAVFDLIDPNAGLGSYFGLMTKEQSNGTIIVTKPGDEVGGAANAGAVYYYDSTNGGLLSAFYGTNAGDKVGFGDGGDSLYGAGLTFLNKTTFGDTSKAYLILSPNWNGNRGAVTWVAANQMIGGVVSAGNSLVGGVANSYLGANASGSLQVDVLSSGNYVIRSPEWNDQRGAITFGTAAAGITGTVSTSNSLTGSISKTTNGNGRTGDSLGSGGTVQLANGNFLVLSPEWSRQGGALSFGNGNSGFAAVGVLGSSNSLVAQTGGTLYTGTNLYGPNNYGFYGGDHIAASTSYVTELASGDFVLRNTAWGHGRGAVTLGSGTTGITGVVSSANSLVGVTVGTGDTFDGTYNYFTSGFGQRDYYGGDAVGGGITELGNGAWVISSASWGTNRGAITYVAAGTTSLSGTITGANSLTGSTQGTFGGYDGFHRGSIGGGDQIGGVTALANHNYVVNARFWDSARGAVTLMNGTNGHTVNASNGTVSEVVSTSNSLVGGASNDTVGNSIITLKGTSDFITTSYGWQSGKGAVTRVSGSSGLVATVSSANSLVGTTAYETAALGGDELGGGGVVALDSGAYVILSPNWNKQRGAATFAGSGATLIGNVSASNSLVGSTGAIGNAIYCNTCNNSGAAIFGGDQVGSSGVTKLANGNFLLRSATWNGSRGAITYVDGITGQLVTSGSMTGVISSANSLVGDQSGTVYDSQRNVNGNYVGLKYYVGGDRLGSTEASVQILTSGDFLLMSSNWHNNTGAITFGHANGTLGSGAAFAGVINSANSLVGSTAATLITPSDLTQADRSLDSDGDKVGGYGFAEIPNGNFLLLNSAWSENRGAITFGSGTSGVQGVISSGNSLVGDQPSNQANNQGGDRIGDGVQYYMATLPNGDVLIPSYYWHDNRGAVTRLSSTQATTGFIDATNSFVGAQVNDYVGGGGFTLLANGEYVVNSYSANSNVGAMTWSGALGGSLTGTLSSYNSYFDSALLGGGYAYTLKTSNPSSFIMNFAFNDSGHVTLGFTDPSGWTYARAPQGTLTIAPSLIANALNSGTSLVLQANNDIILNSAIIANSHSSANLTLTAGRSIIGHNDIDIAGGTLTLLANDSVANGVVDAYRDPGNADISFDPGTLISAAAVDIRLATSSDKTNNGIGDVVLAGINAGTVSAINEGGGSLRLYGTISAAASGTSILLSTLGAFGNFVGAGALNPGAGRFLVYSADPQNNAKGGIVSDGRFFGSTLNANPPSSYALGDDLFLYSITPTLTVTASGTVGYGDTLSSLPLSITGFLDGDTANTALSGSVNISTTYQPGDAVGGNHVVTVAQNSLLSTNGYTLNVVNGSVTVTPKVLSLSLVGTSSKIYDGASAAILAGNNYQLTGFYSSDSIGVTKTSGTFGSTNVGTGLSVGTTLASGDFVAANGTLLSNYVLPTGLVSGNIGEITPKTLTLSGVSAAGRDYNGLTSIALSGGTLNGIVGSDNVTLVAGSGSINDANIGVNRAVTVTGYGITGTAIGNYSFAGQPTGLTATIAPKALTLTGVSAAGRSYDGTNSIVLSGGTLNGIIGNEDVTLVAGSGSILDRNIGVNRAVTASGYGIAGTGAGNYTLSAQPTGLTATILAKSLTLTGVTAVDRDYDASTVVGLTGGALNGVVGNDDVIITYGTGSIVSQNIGIGKAVTVSGYGISGNDIGNYSFAGQPTGLTVNIAAKALTLTGLSATDRSYDGSQIVALTGGMLNGVIGNEQVGFTGGVGQMLDKNVGVGKAVSLSGFGLNGGGAGNYVLNGQPAGLTVTIGAKTLNLTGVSAIGRAYDGSQSVALSGGTLGGIVGNDDVTLVAGSGSILDRNIGVNRAVTVIGYGLTGTEAGNYALAGQPTGLTATIMAKALTLSGVTATNRAYDGSTVVGLTGGTLNGIVGNDDVIITNGTGSIVSQNIGIGKAVTVIGYGIGGNDVGNYSLSGQPTGLTVDIAAKLLTLSGLTATDRAYDGTQIVALTGGTLNGIIGNEQVGFTGGVGQTLDKNVGIGKTVTLSGFTLNGGGAGNYALSSQPGNLTTTISAKTLSLTGVSASGRAYDGTQIVALSGGTLGGIVGNDDVTLVSGSGSLIDGNVGVNKAVTITGYGLTGGEAGNYALAGQPSGLTATIAAKVLTLTGVTATNRAYDGSTVVGLTGGALNGIVGNDDVIITNGTGSILSQNIGIGKAVTVIGYGIGGTGAGNYSLSGQPTGLTVDIAAKLLSLSGISAIDRAYDGTTSVALSGGILSGIVGNEQVGFTGGAGTLADRNVGIGKAVTLSGFILNGSGAGNYALASQPGNLTTTISAKILTLTGVSAINRTYDGSTIVLLSGGTLGGIVDSEVVSLSGGVGALNDKNIGTNKAVIVSGFGLTGAGAGNYALAGQPTGLTADIAVRSVTLNGVTALDRVYDGTTVVDLSGGTLAGLVSTDVVNLIAGSASVANKTVGVNKAVSVSGFGLSGLDAGNYSLTGQPGGLTTTIAARSVTLNGVGAVNRTYDGTTGVALSGGTLSGLVSTDAVALVTGSASMADKGAGAGKAVTVSGYGLSGADAGNYSFAGQPGGLTVDIATRSVTLDGVSAVARAYNGGTSVGLTGGTLNGLVSTDAVSLVSGSASIADKNAGVGKAVSVSGYGLTGADAANYSFAGQPAGLTVTINPAALTASFVPGSISKVYDGTSNVAVSGGAYSLAGLAAGDVITFNGLNGTLASTGVGNGIGVTTTIGAGSFTAGAGTSLANYVLPTGTIAGTTATVTKAPLTIIAEDKAKQAGDPLPALTVRYTGFVGSDSASVLNSAPTLTTNATAASIPGNYGITAAGAQAANYSIAYVDGVLTVVPAPNPVAVTALITVNIPEPIVQPTPPGGSGNGGSGNTASDVVISTGQSQAFIPPTVPPSGSSTSTGTAQSSLTAYDSGAQNAHSYANGFLNSLELEVQQ